MSSSSSSSSIAQIVPEGMLAVVVAPNVRYVNETVGQYDGQEVTFDWPDTGGVIDNENVRVYADDARLLYWNGSGNVLDDRLIDLGINLKSNTFRGVLYPRDSTFYDRDCKPGDIVVIKKNQNEFVTEIENISGEIIPEEIDIFPSAGNKGNQGESLSADQISGTVNSVNISNINISNYDGTKYDALNAIYYIRVVSGGDPSSARLRIRSALEKDLYITPSDWGVPTLVSIRGIYVTFSRTGEDVFVTGQEWRLNVQQAYTAAMLVAGDMYNGEKDRLYVFTVTSGGSPAAVTFSSDDGMDIGGPVWLYTFPVPVGQFGITLNFDRLPSNLNDVFYANAYARGIGTYTRIVTKDQIPPDFYGEVEVELYIPADDHLIWPVRGSQPGVFNYEILDGGIKLNSGILVYENSWRNGDEQLPLPLSYGNIRFKYAIFDPSSADTVHLVSSETDIDEIVGEYTYDNPLKVGTLAAFKGSSETSVAYVAVANPRLSSSWLAAVEKALKYPKGYSIVLLCEDPDIILACADLINEYLENGWIASLWLTAIWGRRWTKLPRATTRGTITDSGEGEYKLLTITSGTTELVRPGDLVGYNFGTDPWGQETYESDVIIAVLDQTRMLLRDGSPNPIADPIPMEIFSDLLETNKKIEYALHNAKLLSNYNARLVYGMPEEAYNVINAYYVLPAVLAGMRSCKSLNEPLRGVIRDIVTEDEGLSEDDLARLLDGGVSCVVPYSVAMSNIVSEAVTTADSASKMHREVFAAIRDYCYRGIMSLVLPVATDYNSWINAAPDIHSRVESFLMDLKKREPGSAPTISDFTINSIDYDAQSNTVNIDVELEMPDI